MHPSHQVEGVELIAVGRDTLARAQRQVVSCQRCDPDAWIPFELLVDDGAKQSGTVKTKYLLPASIRCPRCSGLVSETTRVGFDLESEFSLTPSAPEIEDATAESMKPILVSPNILREAQEYVAGCEACCDAAYLEFDYILDALTGADPTTTEYILTASVKCPRCSSDVTDKTLILAA